MFYCSTSFAFFYITFISSKSQSVILQQTSRKVYKNDLWSPPS